MFNLISRADAVVGLALWGFAIVGSLYAAYQIVTSTFGIFATTFDCLK